MRAGRLMGWLTAAALLVPAAACSSAPAQTVTSPGATTSAGGAGGAGTGTAAGIPSGSAKAAGSATADRPVRDPQTGLLLVNESALPKEARDTLRLIRTAGPFPYAKDGTVYNNFNGTLPAHPRGWYREYTVDTPGENDRGPRRIVAGTDGMKFYTADHYSTFRRIKEGV